MSNLTITLEVKPTPELVQLFAPLFAALQPKQGPAPIPVIVQPPVVPQPIPATPVSVAPASVNPTPAAPISAAINATPAPTAVYAQTPYPSNPVPVAAAPAFTFDDLARAAAQLMDAGKQKELIALLGQFAVQSMQQLPKEQYGAFATALRQLGARI